MIGPSKILTVSYGTFSCTLEGFDDPFSTMRGIAEYFRDLAADDRYFGAEPPTPDAEMLHRIAETEVHRRVESRVEPNGIVLRQTDDQVAEHDTAAEFDTGSEAAEPVVEEKIAATPVADADEVTPPSQNEYGSAGAESVAEKLARIRAVVSQGTDDYADESEDIATAETPITTAFEDISDTPEAVEEDVEAPAQDDEEGEVADLAAVETAASTEADEADETEADEADETEADEADDTEDEPQDQLIVTDEQSSFAKLVAAETSAVEEDDDSQDADDVEENETVSRLLKMRLGDFEQSTQDANELEDDTSEPALLADSGQDAAAEDAASSDEPEPQEEEATSLSEEDEADLIAEPDSADDDDQASDPDEPPAKVRPISRPEGVQVARLLEVTNHEMADGEASRRRSSIEHLKAAVAATRAEREHVEEHDLSDDADDDDTDPYREDLARVVRPRRPEKGRQTPRRLPPLMLVSEQRVDLDQKAEDPITLAEASMVRPRRISSQDADAGGDTDDDLEGENIFSETGSFVEFAREMGATELPDLLEAAAAYYSYVEGQPHFSRLQIMSAVAAVNDAGEFSREDGLRSFGMLVRRGKIRKIRRGQFAATDQTRFRPELRAGE